MIVIKVGGNELESAEFLQALAGAVAALPERPVIVHGGGLGTTRLMERLGLEARFLEGQRVTDLQTLELTVMGLVGQASTQLVQALVNGGLPALGLSGVDAGFVTAARTVVSGGDLGAVGKPIAVHAERLRVLVDAGFIPCIAPISLSEAGALLNVNADYVAQAVAAALDAEMLVLLTNVPAVRVCGERMALLTIEQVEAEIASGEISGGMIPKTRGAVEAVQAGVQRALITDIAGLLALARGEAAGTTIVSDAIHTQPSYS